MLHSPVLLENGFPVGVPKAGACTYVLRHSKLQDLNHSDFRSTHNGNLGVCTLHQATTQRDIHTVPTRRSHTPSTTTTAPTATATTMFGGVVMIAIISICSSVTTIDAFPVAPVFATPTSRGILRHISTAVPAPVSKSTRVRLNAVSEEPKSFLENIFSSFSSTVATKSKQITPPPKYDTVVIEPDYRIAGLFLGFGCLLDTIPYIQLTIGPFITLLGILFLVQSFRIRFVFTEDNQFELKTVQSPTSATLKDSGENVIVGGANIWDCNTIVNYDFFPRSMMDLPFFEQPVLIYFKETQTPASTWNEGPGKIANDPTKVANGNVIPGQVHFFPAICNAKQIEREFQKRNVQKL